MKIKLTLGQLTGDLSKFLTATTGGYVEFLAVKNDNPDDNAIKVMNSDGEQIGWVPSQSKEQEPINAMIKTGNRVRGIIIGSSDYRQWDEPWWIELECRSVQKVKNQRTKPVNDYE